MDTSYLDRRRPNYLILIIPLILLALIIGGVYLFVKSRQGLVSPVPPTPSFEVIFMTPTPEPVSPTASPSAKPRVTSRPTGTPRPTNAKSPTPTKANATGSPSPTSTSSPTTKPSNTPTP